MSKDEPNIVFYLEVIADNIRESKYYEVKIKTKTKQEQYAIIIMAYLTFNLDTDERVVRTQLDICICITITSAGGLLVSGGIIHSLVSASARTWFIRSAKI